MTCVLTQITILNGKFTSYFCWKEHTDTVNQMKKKKINHVLLLWAINVNQKLITISVDRQIPLTEKKTLGMIWQSLGHIWPIHVCGNGMGRLSDDCVWGMRTQPLICIGHSVHYWGSCAINKGGYFEIAFTSTHICLTLKCLLTFCLTLTH